MAYHLTIISSTVRPGRKGPLIGNWVAQQASANTALTVKFIDLGEQNLPLMNEAKHPALQQYEHEHTKTWSKIITHSDAFIFVTAEYNYGYPAPLKNALEYLSKEWEYKPAGIVSYGGVSAGCRAAKSLQGDLCTFKIVPVTPTIHLPFFNKMINEKGVFSPPEIATKAADEMLKEILKWCDALKNVRS
jgi:NAD(P)H-dependent FMN reductase